MSYFTYLECTVCGAKYPRDQLVGACRCGKVLFARYDLKRAKEEISPDTFRCGTASLWRYKTLLPIYDDHSIVTLGEGMTPLLSAASLGREIQIPRLMIKDEGINPTGTFKARGAAVGVSKLKELGTEHIVMTSSGNAGPPGLLTAGAVGCTPISSCRAMLRKVRKRNAPR